MDNQFPEYKWIRHTGKPKIIKFQQFKVMSWNLFDVKDNGTIPRSDIRPHPIDYFYGEMKICEMPGQPVNTIRATVGSELCLLHGPDTSILLKDFYIKQIQIETHNGYYHAEDYLHWDKEVKNEVRILDDLRNLIWIMTFRYTGVEIASKPVQEAQFDMVKGAGWGEENKDGTTILPKEVGKRFKKNKRDYKD